MKNLKNTILIFFTVIIIVTLIYNVEVKLDSIKENNNLTETSIVHNAPPMIAFTTVALGGFRGIIADILWLRTIILQSQGKYFEMVQLASWISKLQPGFTGTTTFLAWNMAYNISITYANPKDKWRWVQNGIKILKDAIRNTPNKLDLYPELAFIYLNKIGNIYDSSYLYYRNQIAKDMYRVTGTWTPDWQAIADAPKTSNELTRTLKQKFDIDNIFDKTDYTPEKLQVFFEKNNKLPNNIAKILQNNIAATDLLIAFLRRNWLINKYYLYPEKILEVNNTFGPIDWSLYQAHAIYWLYQASENAVIDDGKVKSRIFSSANQSLENGKLLLFNFNDDKILFTGPNISIIEKTQTFMHKILQKIDKKSDFADRYKSFIENSILQLFIQNKIKQAQHYLSLLSEYYPNDKNYSINLKNFIEYKTPQKYWFHNKASIEYEIERLIKLSSIYRLKKDKSTSDGFMNFAKIMYTTYNLNNENKLPHFEKMKESINVVNIKNNLISK
jgi:hypothetical protein